ncbi:conserved hypothetical protein [Chlorobium limicola DSM 245]|uniref:Porin domain-containing protein n=1 Tax=Chlorobium limicola (strain DSM 245 / NBRC 103803 / 6330) TaxID=290315 RepID=B3EEM1_CHLL2|nr:porin [Chlorobium limicola]ACD90831.1 conserved hypothetical protein [Chlorobium limicola DSM 245]
MKKMLSLAAMFAVLGYASPASAEVKFSGDASLRLRGEFTDYESNWGSESESDDLNWAMRVRLKASADLGEGYFFKAMLTNDNSKGGWTSFSGNLEDIEIDVSNFYFGRMMQDSHYMMGRLPLNSVNNPIFDLALFPTAPVDIPVATVMMDRVLGINYGTKVGPGEFNSTLVILNEDSPASDNGMLNDGYAAHLSYKANLGNVTIEPQALVVLTDGNGLYNNITPHTFGMNVTVPTGDAKIGLSGFYTVCKDDDAGAAGNTDVDYSGYLLRLKGEVGPFMAWVDYNHTDDNTDGYEEDYDNLFVWAQYNYKVYDSAMGSFSLTPTVRYWAIGDNKDEYGWESESSRLRTELIATVTF